MLASSAKSTDSTDSATLRTVVAACRAVLASSGPIEVADEYGYTSLPLCVIDSVFSIGVRYESVRNVIDRYCRRFDLPKQAPKGTVPLRDQQESITGFLIRVVPIDADRLATEVFGNRQRTSARNGILKANAVVSVRGRARAASNRAHARRAGGA